VAEKKVIKKKKNHPFKGQ